MNPTRRSVLAAGGAVSIAALAGCMGDGAELDVGATNVDPEEDLVTIQVEIDEPPLDVEVEITTLDEDGEVVDEIFHTETIEEEEQAIVFEVEDGISEDFEDFEWAVREA